jgi:DNA-binding transcriptional MocR family regulator
MIRHLLHVDFDPRRGLQEQVRETLVNAILSGIFSADTPLPSCRQLASQLRVSRNTTALVLSLVNEGISSAARAAVICIPIINIPPRRCRQSAPHDESAAPRWGARCKSPPASRSRFSNRRLDELPLPVYLRPAGYPPVPAGHLALGGKLAARGCATRPGSSIISTRTCRC